MQKPLRKTTCKKSSLATGYGLLGGPIWNFTRFVLDPQIEGMVKEHGISLDELFPQTGREKSQRKEKRPRGERTVKYRNPADPSQTWIGTGRKPAWLTEALTSGKTLQDFEV